MHYLFNSKVGECLRGGIGEWVREEVEIEIN